jgi:hypothetical protein
MIPYIVSGSGGFNAKADSLPVPPAPYTEGDTRLEINPVIEYGYLTVTIDMTTAQKKLAIAFHSPRMGRNYDHVEVDLMTHQLIPVKPAGQVSS